MAHKFKTILIKASSEKSFKRKLKRHLNNIEPSKKVEVEKMIYGIISIS